MSHPVRPLPNPFSEGDHARELLACALEDIENLKRDIRQLTDCIHLLMRIENERKIK